MKKEEALQVLGKLREKAPPGVQVFIDGTSFRAKKDERTFSMKQELFEWDGKIIPEIVQDFADIVNRIVGEDDCEGECHG